MMNKPAVNELQQKVGCRYMLVTTISKRARQLLVFPRRRTKRKTIGYSLRNCLWGW